MTELELPELREVPKAGGLGRGPAGGGRGGASNVVRRLVLASSILGVSAITVSYTHLTLPTNREV